MSALEEEFALQLKAYRINGWVREYRFDPVRRWRFDFAWPDLQLAVELQGGIFGRKSGHNTGAGIRNGMEKLNRAQIAGWTVLQFYVDDVKSGAAALLVSEFLVELESKRCG
jgi:very-short-patch-repair endonuclease